jgi:hypothetical protein
MVRSAAAPPLREPGYDVEAGAFDLVMTILERLTPAERTRVMTRACLWAEVP